MDLTTEIKPRTRLLVGNMVVPPDQHNTVVFFFPNAGVFFGFMTATVQKTGWRRIKEKEVTMHTTKI